LNCFSESFVLRKGLGFYFEYFITIIDLSKKFEESKIFIYTYTYLFGMFRSFSLVKLQEHIIIYRTINHILESTYCYNPNTNIVCLTPNVNIDHGLKLVIWMISLFALVRVFCCIKKTRVSILSNFITIIDFSK